MAPSPPFTAPTPRGDSASKRISLFLTRSFTWFLTQSDPVSKEKRARRCDTMGAQMGMLSWTLRSCSARPLVSVGYAICKYFRHNNFPQEHLNRSSQYERYRTKVYCSTENDKTLWSTNNQARADWQFSARLLMDNNLMDEETKFVFGDEWTYIFTYISNSPSHHSIGFREWKHIEYVITLYTCMLQSIIHEVPEQRNIKIWSKTLKPWSSW